MHRATVMYQYQLCIDVTRCRRRGNIYGDRVFEVEFASFTPLVFATTGSMGKEAITFYHWFADLLSKRNVSSHTSTLEWLRCIYLFHCWGQRPWEVTPYLIGHGLLSGPHAAQHYSIANSVIVDLVCVHFEFLIIPLIDGSVFLVYSYNRTYKNFLATPRRA